MSTLIYILIITNGLIVLFFLQLVIYGIISYYYHWRGRKNVVYPQKDLPYITLVVPARSESRVIGATINHLMELNYPRDRYEILIVLDDKELADRPLEETTHRMVELKQRFFNQLYQRPIIRSVSVPLNFNGDYPGRLLKNKVASSKPRALNWALRFIPANCDVVGFYDADSRPDKDVLRYISYYWKNGRPETFLFQGAVIQTRNFSEIELFNKLYALAQAITHEWFLPVLLRHLPFIGGTNFFISRRLLTESGGFNNRVVSEDLEFGCRVYLEKNIWPQFLPCVSTEQTPPDYRAYFIQRARWATGYVQVMEDMLQRQDNLFKRFYLFIMLVFYGILPWAVTQIVTGLTIGILLVSLLGLAHISSFLPQVLKQISLVMNVSYLLFTLYYFEYAKRKLYIPLKVVDWPQKIFNYLAICSLPLAALLGTTPYTYGFILGLFSNSRPHWVKTPRTREN